MHFKNIKGVKGTKNPKYTSIAWQKKILKKILLLAAPVNEKSDNTSSASSKEVSHSNPVIPLIPPITFQIIVHTDLKIKYIMKRNLVDKFTQYSDPNNNGIIKPKQNKKKKKTKKKNKTKQNSS